MRSGWFTQPEPPTDMTIQTVGTNSLRTNVHTSCLSSNFRCLLISVPTPSERSSNRSGNTGKTNKTGICERGAHDFWTRCSRFLNAVLTISERGNLGKTNKTGICERGAHDFWTRCPRPIRLFHVQFAGHNGLNSQSGCPLTLQGSLEIFCLRGSLRDWDFKIIISKY